MSVIIHSFAPLLLRRKEPPMHNRHCRSLIDTMKSLSPAAWTLKPLRMPSNRWSQWHHFIRLLPLIVHVVYRRTWYVCRIEKKTVNWHFPCQNTENLDTLATRGLEEPFFQLSVFWFWREIGFGFTYYLCAYVRGLGKILWSAMSGYIVGTYIISEWVERQSWDEK